jgi:hypothetical protein
MASQFPTCPRCQSTGVFRVTKDGAQVWRCSCDQKWPGTQAEKKIAPAISPTLIDLLRPRGNV